MSDQEVSESFNSPEEMPSATVTPQQQQAPLELENGHSQARQGQGASDCSDRSYVERTQGGSKRRMVIRDQGEPRVKSVRPPINGEDETQGGALNPSRAPDMDDGMGENANPPSPETQASSSQNHNGTALEEEDIDFTPPIIVDVQTWSCLTNCKYDWRHQVPLFQLEVHEESCPSRFHRTRTSIDAELGNGAKAFKCIYEEGVPYGYQSPTRRNEGSPEEEEETCEAPAELMRFIRDANIVKLVSTTTVEVPEGSSHFHSKYTLRVPSTFQVQLFPPPPQEQHEHEDDEVEAGGETQDEEEGSDDDEECEWEEGSEDDEVVLLDENGEVQDDLDEETRSSIEEMRRDGIADFDEGDDDVFLDDPVNGGPHDKFVPDEDEDMKDP